MAKTVRRGAIVTISAPADYGKIEYHAFSDDRTGWLVIDPESFVGVGPQRGRTARKYVIASSYEAIHLSTVGHQDGLLRKNSQ